MKKKIFIILLSVVVLLSSFLIPCSAAEISLQHLLQTESDDLFTVRAYAEDDNFDLPLRYTWYRDYYLITYEEGIYDPVFEYDHIEFLSHSEFIKRDVKPDDLIILSGTFYLGNPSSDLFYGANINQIDLKVSYILQNDVTGAYDYVPATVNKEYYEISSSGYIAFRGSISLTVPVGYSLLQGIKIDYYFPLAPFPFDTRMYFQTNNKPLELYVGNSQNAPIYPVADSKTFDDYSDQEGDLIDATSGGLDDAIDAFNNIGNLFTPNGSMYKGVLFMGSLMRDLVGDLPAFGDIVLVALSLGLVTFVLGTGVDLAVRSFKGSKTSNASKGGGK